MSNGIVEPIFFNLECNKRKGEKKREEKVYQTKMSAYNLILIQIEQPPKYFTQQKHIHSLYNGNEVCRKRKS